MSPNNASIALRQAAPSDCPAVEALLLVSKLPTEGAREHLPTYLLAESNGEVVGTAEAEVYGLVALLRSVAIAPALQRRGIGRLLRASLLEEEVLAAARRRLLWRKYRRTTLQRSPGQAAADPGLAAASRPPWPPRRLAAAAEPR